MRHHTNSVREMIRYLVWTDHPEGWGILGVLSAWAQLARRMSSCI